MGETRKESGWHGVVALVLALMLVGPGAYVAGYFALSRVTEFGGSHGPDEGPGPFYGRVFRYEWQATIYKPAARVESWVRDKNYVAASS